MPDSDSNKNDKSGDLSEVEIQKRLDEAHEKFDRNYVEFKRKKIAEAPCFRSTFLTGIPAGMIIGLCSYLVTSRARLASNMAMASYLMISAGYFTNCRIEFNKKLEQNKELGEIMNLIIRYRGTELEEQFQTKYKEKLEEIDKKSKYV